MTEILCTLLVGDEDPKNKMVLMSLYTADGAMQFNAQLTPAAARGIGDALKIKADEAERVIEVPRNPSRVLKTLRGEN